MIGLFITEGYNFIKSQINPQAIHIPEVIPLVFGIVGIGLLIYIVIQNKRKREEELGSEKEELRQLEEGEPSDSQKQRENNDKYTPTGFK